MFFLRNPVERRQIEEVDVLRHYCRLDDSDVLYSLKQWATSSDPIIADLSRRFLDRDFLRVQFLEAEPDKEMLADLEAKTLDWMNERDLLDASATGDEHRYYTGYAKSSHSAYLRKGSPIAIVDRTGQLHELSHVADTSAIAALSEPVTKPYVFAPKEVLPALFLQTKF
jgi:hypothetical protein